MIFFLVIATFVVLLWAGGKFLVRDRSDPPPDKKIAFSLPDGFWTKIERYEDHLIRHHKITATDRAFWRAKFEDKLKLVEQYEIAWWRSPFICYSSDRKRIIIGGGIGDSARTHELLHLYQEVVFGVLTKERNKELNFIDQISIEIEANRFSTQWINGIFFVVALALLIIFGAAFIISFI